MKKWGKMLFLNDPYIFENGCGIVIPKGYFNELPEGSVDQGGEWRVNLGMGVEEVRRQLREMATQTGIQYRGFEHMTDDEISYYTGLTGEELRMCRQREYDEPFMVNNDEAADMIGSLAGSRGLVVTKGGRFHHLTGGCDKGKAVQILAALYRRENPGIMTFAIGDSQNDVAMFAAVDRAYLVGKPDGSHDFSVPEGAAKRIHAAGPNGFRVAVEEILTLEQEG
jgi:mannosyl-3-phosphoglycerate phosphatase